MPRKLAATLENNAWRSRKHVVADYVPECMHHHSDDKAVVRHRPRRLSSAWLAQEAEGAGGAALKPLEGNAENCLASAVLYEQVKRAIAALIVSAQLSNH
jgi:hypothetical protein